MTSARKGSKRDSADAKPHLAGTERTGSFQGGDVIELAVKVIGLLVLVLPLVGAGVRTIAFAFAGFNEPVTLASRETVGGLASTGVNAVGITIGFTAAFAFLSHRGWFRPMVPRSSWPAWMRWARGLLLVGLAVGLGSIGSFPGGPVSVIAGLAGGHTLTGWTGERRLTFYRSAALVIAMGVATAFAAGLNGQYVGTEVSTYHFVAASGLHDGRYALLAESDGLVYLDSCAGQGIMAVGQGSIVQFTTSSSSPHVNASLIDIVFRNKNFHVGYSRPC